MGLLITTVLLESKARAKDFLYTPNGIYKKMLVELQQFVHGTFWKEIAAFFATKERISSPILNKEDECIDWKACQERKARYKFTFSLLIAWIYLRKGQWVNRKVLYTAGLLVAMDDHLDRLQ